MEVNPVQQGAEEVPATEESLTHVEQPTDEPNGVMDTSSLPDDGKSQYSTVHAFMTLYCLLSVQVLQKKIRCHQ